MSVCDKIDLKIRNLDRKYHKLMEPLDVEVLFNDVCILVYTYIFIDVNDYT